MSDDTQLTPSTPDFLALLTKEVKTVKDRPANIDPLDRSGKMELEGARLPYLRIAQPGVPQVAPNKPEYIKGLTIGEMFNSTSEVVYGNGPLRVVPVWWSVDRIVRDPNDKKKVIARNIPPNDKRAIWTDGPNGERIPPVATEYYQYVCLLLRPPRLPEKIIVTIRVTNKEAREAAEKWATYINGREGAIYSGVYELRSTLISGKAADGQETNYGVFIVKNDDYLPTETPEGMANFLYAREFHNKAKVQLKIIDHVAADDESSDKDTDFDPAALEGEIAEEPPHPAQVPSDM